MREIPLFPLSAPQGLCVTKSRLHHAQRNGDQARHHLSKARDLIQEHAYHHRGPELKALEEMLGSESGCKTVKLQDGESGIPSGATASSLKPPA